MTRQIHQSKTARESAKAVLTRKMNEITELITDINNFQRVQSAYCEFEEASRKFFLAHKNFHAKLSHEDDLGESNAYYEAEVRRTCAFEDKIRSWLSNNENTSTLKNGTDLSNEIKPSDSVSNVGTDCVSKSSRKSKSIRSEVSLLSSRCSSKESVTSAKAAAAARKVVLQEEALRLNRRQQLQKQELFLKRQMEELELETKIVQAVAEERTYSEIGAPENVNVDQCDKSHKLSCTLPTDSKSVSNFMPQRERHSKHAFDVRRVLKSDTTIQAIQRYNGAGAGTMHKLCKLLFSGGSVHYYSP